MISSGPNQGVLISAATGDQFDVAFRKFLRSFDVRVFLAVKSRTSVIPGAPANGDRYLVTAGASGAWAGQVNSVATWTTDDPATPGGYWEFHVPQEGWVSWSAADAGFYVFTSSAWVTLASLSPVTSVAGRTGAVVIAEADVTGLVTDLAATEKTANKGVASGYAELDGTGHVPNSQIPAALVGALQYQGTWNANTNSPALASGTGTKGFFYKVSVAGATVLDGNGDWHVGDLAIYDGTVWDKVDNYEAVTSVAGRTGAVVIAEADVTGLVADLALKAATTYVDTQDAAEVTARTTAVGAEATTRAANDATTLSSAETYADAAVAVEASRATTAEALKAPLASPNTTGTLGADTINASKSITTGINAMGNVSGAALSIDLSLGNVITMTLTGNVTSSAWANAVAAAGQEITIIITQDGTGGRTFAWPSAVVPVGPCPSPGASTVSIFKGVVDGAGNVNFSANGGIKVYDVTTAGLNATTSAHQQDFVPPVHGRYRMTFTLWETAIDASGASATIRPFNTAANIAGLQTATNAALGLTVLGGSAGEVCSFVPPPTLSNGKAGWGLTVTGTPTTGTWSVNMTVEYMGN